MYAEFLSCVIFSPANISSNMSVREVITFFPPYLSSSVGIPRGLGTLLLFEDPLKMGPIRYPETSIRNYHCTLRKSQKSAHLIYIAAEA